MCKRHSYGGKWYIGHDMSKGMTERYWSEESQLFLVNWLRIQIKNQVNNAWQNVPQQWSKRKQKGQYSQHVLVDQKPNQKGNRPHQQGDVRPIQSCRREKKGSFNHFNEWPLYLSELTLRKLNRELNLSLLCKGNLLWIWKIIINLLVQNIENDI